MIEKKLFDEKTLREGYELYQTNRIEEFLLSNGAYFASVREIIDYDVQIEPLDNGEYKLFCDCENGFAGKTCKHMAAVFYMIEYRNFNLKYQLFNQNSLN